MYACHFQNNITHYYANAVITNAAAIWSPENFWCSLTRAGGVHTSNNTWTSDKLGKDCRGFTLKQKIWSTTLKCEVQFWERLPTVLIHGWHIQPTSTGVALRSHCLKICVTLAPAFNIESIVVQGTRAGVLPERSPLVSFRRLWIHRLAVFAHKACKSGHDVCFLCFSSNLFRKSMREHGKNKQTTKK